MRVQFTFKHMGSSDGLREITESKFSNLARRYGHDPQRVKVTFSVVGRDKRMHCSLLTDHGFLIEADDVGENAYHLIDTVAQKVDEQLRRYKGRQKARKGAGVKGPRSEARLYLVKNSLKYDAWDEGPMTTSLADSPFWELAPIEAANILGLRGSSCESKPPRSAVGELSPVTTSQAV